jgi:trehalose-6-phosphate synthase
MTTFSPKVSEALNTALTMPEEEQIRKNALMRARLEYYDTEHWGKEFITKLQCEYFHKFRLIPLCNQSFCK